MLQTALVRRFALSLGWLGVAPFAAFAFASVVETGLVSRDFAAQALAVYGGVILSFLGGIAWGLTLGARPGHALGPQDLVAAIAASLIGFAGALSPPAVGLPILAAGFLIALAYDLRHVRGGVLPRWYKALRVGLTSCAVASLAAGALSP
jgi:hypothetical protein